MVIFELLIKMIGGLEGMGSPMLTSFPSTLLILIITPQVERKRKKVMLRKATKVHVYF